MSWDAARAALSTQLLTLPGIDQTQIHWPNTAYTPNGAYWKVDFLPTGNSPEMCGSDHERGIFQVSRFVPPGTGLGPALRDAQSVVDLFKRQVFSGVSVGVPSVALPIYAPDWCHVPVSVPFIVL